MDPKYPIYIISKGRWESRLTSKALEKLNCPYRIVIEPQEYDQYSSVIDKDKILLLPFSNLGQGSIPARNWVWEHSIKEGHERHWILDDNIRRFMTIENGKRVLLTENYFFNRVESYIDKYSNVPIAGLQYTMFAISAIPKDKDYFYPFILNTRIYSCILLSNKISHRWRGRYNEDTDLSLRILKSGYCSILFNSYLCDKIHTMTMKGGNTDELYKQNDNFDGRLEMALSLQRQHPELVKIKKRFNRWQHVVNYKPFKDNKLKFKI